MAGAFYGKQLNHPRPLKALKFSGSYIVGIDISGDKDLSMLTVSRLDGAKITVINTFTGTEAEKMYHQLTGKESSA